MQADMDGLEICQSRTPDGNGQRPLYDIRFDDWDFRFGSEVPVAQVGSCRLSVTCVMETSAADERGRMAASKVRRTYVEDKVNGTF